MSAKEPASLLRGKRFYIILFLFFSVMINYIDRVNIAIAAPVIAKHFHWDPATMGWVFSAFVWTYAACLLPSGWLADRFGARRMSAVAISLWSVAAMLTGAVSSLFTMIMARLALGAGESNCFLMCNKVVRQWFPAKERGFAVGIFNAGSLVSIALATPLVAWVVVHFGWRASFFTFGSLGFVWLGLWLKWFHEPEECSWLPSDERQYILETRSGGPAATSAPGSARPLSFVQALAPLLRQKTMWGLFIAQGCINYMNYLFAAWLPSYLVQAKGMNLMKAGIFTGIPYLIAAILEIGLGKISDRILTPEDIKKGKRRNQVALCLLLTSFVVLINLVNNAWVMTAIITLVVMFNHSAIMFIYALTNDLLEDPQAAGIVFGMLALGGNIFGLAAPIITGYIVKATGRFDSAFAIAGALALIGTVVLLTAARRSLHGPAPIGKEAIAGSI